MYELIIENDGIIYIPAVEDGIKWSTERKYVPGKLEFKCIQDDNLKIEEGNPVRFKKDGQNVFYGFIFKIKPDKDRLISVTAYDQLRYFKNKDTYVYEDKTASEFLKMLIDDFKLQAGEIDDTKFKIETRVEDNVTLFDMMKNALDMTLQNNKEMYILYDDFGKINLKNISNMKLDLLIDEETVQKFNFESSIDEKTYNKIKLVQEDEKQSKREVYIAQSGENMNKWGILQYFDKLKKGENGKEKADNLLKMYNQKTKKLTINNAFGDIRVRGGSLIIVKLKIWDIELKNFMLVEKVDHTFKNNEHFMSLTLLGGEIVE